MRVVVLLCKHCGVPESVASFRAGDDVRVVWCAALCHDVDEALRDVSRDDGLVLVGPELEHQAMIAEQATRAGVHPLRIRSLDSWRALRDGGSLDVHLRAAVARLRGAPAVETSPTRETSRFRGAVLRRSFLVPRTRYRAPLPRIQPDLCRAATGCDLCVRACPASAIRAGLPPDIDPSACDGCGLCVAACPTAAVSHPMLDFEGLEREAEALADGPHVNLLVACTTILLDLRPRDLRIEPGRWRILEAPSLASLRPHEVLRLLAKGFERVVGLGRGSCCPESPGPFPVARAVAEAQGLPGRVASWDLNDGPLPEAWSRPLAGGAVGVPGADSLQAFVLAVAGPLAPAVPLPGRGAGIVTVDPDRCTLCEVCAERCPSGALGIEEPEPASVRLAFSHDRCDACGLCEPACPEKAIRVTPAVDASWAGRSRSLKEDSWALCAACGKRVAPRAMLDRVGARLNSPAGLDLCPDCKPFRLAAAIRRGE